MWEVYWITDDDTKNLTEYGYIGITSRSTRARFMQHINVAGNIKSKGYWRELSKAIRQCGECIKVITLCKCDEEYAKFLEAALRPAENVGWNLAVGGFTPTTKLSAETIAGRLLFKNLWNQFCIHCKAKIEKPWINLNANPAGWADAQKVFEIWADKHCGMRALCTKMGVKRNKRFAKYIKMFKDGWIPIEDKNWRESYGH